MKRTMRPRTTVASGVTPAQLIPLSQRELHFELIRNSAFGRACGAIIHVAKDGDDVFTIEPVKGPRQ